MTTFEWMVSGAFWLVAIAFWLIEKRLEQISAQIKALKKEAP